MNLSILIPTYRYDCRSLVSQLLPLLPADSEIIVGDDCSDDAVIAACNAEIMSWPHCRVLQADHNMGRSAIRNTLARSAEGDWLIFIDADAAVQNDDFIQKYVAAAQDADVVCGGTGNLRQCPRPEAILRYKYEVAAERRLTLAHRQSHPYEQFTTFNFLIRRSLFLSVLFDESCREYGHEDTLFGLELKQRAVRILHIDNKLTHTGLEDSADYLHKVKTALDSLSSMSDEMKHHARVSALAIRLRQLYLLPLVRLSFRLSEPLLRRQLLSLNPSLSIFAFYKLGYYCCLL